MYIYNLPQLHRSQCCRVLDQNLNWRRLGKRMKYDDETLDKYKQDQSPGDSLLTAWSQLNHTVLELYFLLYELKMLDAMIILNRYVEVRYHYLSSKISKEGAGGSGSPSGLAEMKNEVNKIAESMAMATTDNNVSVKKVADSSKNPDSSINKPVAPIAENASDQEITNIPHVPFNELQQATFNWNQSLILGKGGFGIVYKGVWKCTVVAIKRIESHKDDLTRKYLMDQTLLELNCLNQYRHDNILPIYGFCTNGDFPCLVYQYMIGGNVEQRVRRRNNSSAGSIGATNQSLLPANFLHWPERLTIARGVARGLQFLHTIREKPLIHGDIKSANILLDANNDPKIGDFGLAKEGPAVEYVMVSRVHGTRPYLPDEYLRARKMSVKIDTYSFGVVLFELATGLGAYAENREHRFLKDHVVNFEGDPIELRDGRCHAAMSNVFYEFINVGKCCVNRCASKRPDMRAVLHKLDAIRG